VRTYEIIIDNTPELLVEIEKEIKLAGLRIESRKRHRKGADLACAWRLHGKPHQHETIIEKLLENPNIKEFDN
jgi:hypothetical protein